MEMLLLVLPATSQPREGVWHPGLGMLRQPTHGHPRNSLISYAGIRHEHGLTNHGAGARRSAVPFKFFDEADSEMSVQEAAKQRNATLLRRALRRNATYSLLKQQKRNATLLRRAQRNATQLRRALEKQRQRNTTHLRRALDKQRQRNAKEAKRQRRARQLEDEMRNATLALLNRQRCVWEVGGRR